MNKLVVFNWKMNPSSLQDATALFDSIPQMGGNLEIVVAAPFVYLEKLVASASAKGYGGLRFASQNCFWENSGAYTGEISPLMLKSIGIEYVIIGHSERRNYLRESDEMIAKKVRAALSGGLKVILCISELSQLTKDLSQNENLIVAYEPIWAIGTGNSCKPQDASEMAKNIKKILNVKVLYGGSVDSNNIQDFLKYEEIDGALVGGASLKIDEVKKICQLII